MERTVVVNATSIGSRPDGISVYGTLLLEALARTRTDLTFVVLLNETARPRFQAFTWPPHMTVHWLGRCVSPDEGPRGNLLRLLFAQASALRHHRRLSFAISQLEASMVGGPRMVTVHDVAPLLFPEFHPRQNHYYRYWLGTALRRSAAVVTPSRTTKDLLEAYYGLAPGRVHVIPHGVPVPRRAAANRPPPKQPFILFLGRANPMKNAETLLRAFSLILPNVRENLVIAGTGVALAGLLPGASPALRGRVIVRPDVSEQEKIDLLDEASALIQPSLDEGFGLPPLEAMNRGCPVVAADAGSLPEVCSDAALYVPSRNVGALASTMVRVLTDTRLRGSLVERGLRRAGTFSWEDSARSHVDVFESVLAEAR